MPEPGYSKMYSPSELVSSHQRDSWDPKSSGAVSFQDRLFAAAQDDTDALGASGNLRHWFVSPHCSKTFRPKHKMCKVSDIRLKPNISILSGTSELSFVPQDRLFGSRAHLKDKLCPVTCLQTK